MIDDYLMDNEMVAKTLTVLVIFSILIIASSYYWPDIARTPLGGYIEGSSEEIKESARSFTGVRYLVIPFYIFIRNSLVSIISGLLGVTVIVPFSIIAVNAMIIGYVIYNALNTGVAGSVIASLLLPHGSIELPAISVSATIALYLVDILWSRRVELLRIIKRNIILSITMLVFSALIEAFITPLIAIVLLLLLS